MYTLLGCALSLMFAAAPAKPAPKPQAKKDPTAAVVDQVQKYYEKTKDYTAEFIQSYTKIALSQESESRGTIMLKRPGLMRWAYDKPVEKLWVIDGKKLYVVDPEFQQVFVDPNFRSAEISTSIRFLWGEGKLTDTFNAKLIEAKPFEADKKLVALELVPKTGATYARMVLLVDPATGEVSESIIYETSGNTNRFKFRNAKTNTGLKDELFTYVPPEGWEVIPR